MSWLLRTYDRRIVNVNVNILAAGLLAVALTVAAMHLLQRWGVLDALSAGMPDLAVRALGHTYTLDGHTIVITSLTFVVDVAIDVGVYYLLHWLANHTPRQAPRPRSAAYADLSFMRDATLVQFERAALSPLLYAIALGLQNKLLHHGWSVESATFAGFGAGLLVTRVLHTIYMLYMERRAGRQTAADIVGPDIAPPTWVVPPPRPPITRSTIPPTTNPTKLATDRPRSKAPSRA